MQHASHDGKLHIDKCIHIEIPGAFLRLKGQLRQQRRRSVTFVAGQLGMGGQLVRPCGLFHDMTTGTEGTRIRHPHTPSQPCQHAHAQRNAAQQHIPPRPLAGCLLRQSCLHMQQLPKPPWRAVSRRAANGNPLSPSIKNHAGIAPFRTRCNPLEIIKDT